MVEISRKKFFFPSFFNLVIQLMNKNLLILTWSKFKHKVTSFILVNDRYVRLQDFSGGKKCLKTLQVVKIAIILSL